MYNYADAIDDPTRPATRRDCGAIGSSGFGGKPEAGIAILRVKPIIRDRHRCFSGAQCSSSQQRVGDHMHDQVIHGRIDRFAFTRPAGGGDIRCDRTQGIALGHTG